MEHPSFMGNVVLLISCGLWGLRHRDPYRIHHHLRVKRIHIAPNYIIAYVNSFHNKHILLLLYILQACISPISHPNARNVIQSHEEILVVMCVIYIFVCFICLCCCGLVLQAYTILILLVDAT